MNDSRRPCLCLACGWRGSRKAAPHQRAPCPKCSSPQVAMAGSKLPLPRDPGAIVSLLNADPGLLWRVQRGLAHLQVAGPWAHFGEGYWERSELGGGRAAWIERSSMGSFQWETAHQRGYAPSVGEAADQADAALLDEGPHRRLVPSSGRGGAGE